MTTFQCDNGSCAKSRGGPLHAYSQTKTTSVCLHTLIAEHINPEVTKTARGDPLFDHCKTVEKVVSKISQNFPTFSDQSDINGFLVKNANFVQSFVNKSDEEQAQMISNKQTTCDVCDFPLKKWRGSTKNSYFISMGHIKLIKMDVLHCENCQVLLYPDLYTYGIIPIHNKFLVSYDYLHSMLIPLSTGAPLVETIEKQLQLRMRREGFTENLVKTDTR